MPRMLVVGALLFGAVEARASCPVPSGAAPSLGMADDSARLAWIEDHLDHSARRSRRWVWGWSIGIGAATAAQLAMIPILGDTRDNRIDFGLGAATTIVGIVPLLLIPPRVIEDRAALAARPRSDGDTCAVLAEAERLLVANAVAEGKQRKWYVHAGNVVLNAGVTLLFGAFHHWSTGVISGVGGVLIGEVIIYTEPVDQIDDVATYQRGELTATPVSWQVVPTVGQGALGLALSVQL